MIVGVADTHTALWHLFADPNSPAPAEDFIQAAAAKRNKVAVSAISMAELVYLVEKNRLPISAYDGLSRALRPGAWVHRSGVDRRGCAVHAATVPRGGSGHARPDRGRHSDLLQGARYQPRCAHTLRESSNRLVRLTLPCFACCGLISVRSCKKSFSRR
jgi:hypothetical protein